MFIQSIPLMLIFSVLQLLLMMHTNMQKEIPFKHPLGYDMQLREPLDFYAVTDHGFLLGSVEGWADPK